MLVTNSSVPDANEKSLTSTGTRIYHLTGKYHYLGSLIKFHSPGFKYILKITVIKEFPHFFTFIILM